MKDVVLFSILGLGAGTAYALTASGVVLIYKGTGVVNFGQSAIAMFSALSFVALYYAGVSKWMAALVCVVGSIVGGALFYQLVMRPLRDSPLLAKVVATIGLLVTLQGLASVFWLHSLNLAPALFPQSTVELFGAAVSVDRLYLLGIAVALGVVLWATFRYTRIGLATRATAENERGAALLGFSPHQVGLVNWAAGAGLAGLAGVLIAPIAVLDINALTVMILPALGAALIGRFSSFGLTIAAGLLIGVGQSLLTQYWAQQGVGDALPFLVVIIAMVVTGKLIPPRGTLGHGRPPFVTDGRVRPLWVVVVPLLAILGLSTLNGVYQGAITTSMVFVIIALSLVVVTGFVGQASLVPMTFAGVGAFLVSKLAHNLGIPFPWSILLAAAAAVPFGVLIGLPALRVRGINLAVVTLGAAVAIDSVVFHNLSWTGGVEGSPVPSPSLAGFSLDSTLHPARFGIFVLVVMGALMIMVSGLPRTTSGRRMLAVRANERAAASAGINVPAVKIQAFALSTVLAALGGAVLAYQFGTVSYDRFGVVASISVVTLVYIGGIASVSGALLAGVMATGGISYALISQVSALDRYWLVLTGLTLLLTVVTQPDGIAVTNQRLIRGLSSKWARRGGTPPPDAGPAGAEQELPSMAVR